MLLVILVLVPVAFSRWTEDAWDFPKGILLTTGALVLASWGLAAELSRAQQSGLRPWADAAGARLWKEMRRDPLGGAMLLFVASSAVSAIASPNPGFGIYGAAGSYSGLLVAGASATLYFASRTFSRNSAYFARLCTATGIAAAIASAYGVVQFLGRDPISWGSIPYLRGLRRVAGTLGQPNLLGAFLAMALPLMAWSLLRSATWLGRVLWGATMLLSLVALGMTFSRASWLALAVSGIAGALLYAWTRPVLGSESAATRRRTAALLTAALIIALGVAGAITSRTPMGSRIITRVREIANMKETGNAARIEAWRLGIHMASTRPLVGVGTDQFGWEFPAYRTPAYYRLEYGNVPPTAHNVAINVLANQGVPGLLVGILIVVFCIGATARALRQLDPWVHGAVVAAAMALTAFLLWDLVNYTVAAVGTLTATLAGWVAGIALQPTAAGATKAQGSRQQPVSAGAVVLSSVLFLIAFMIAILRPVLGQYAQRVALSQPVGSRSQVEAIQRAAQLAPWEARYQNHLAGAYLAIESGEPDAQRRLAVLNLARAASEKAIATDARYAPFYARYGWVLARLIVSGAPDVRVEQVRTVLATAIHRDPANRDILDGNTETWLMLNRHKEARIDALRSSELYPELAKPMGYIGLIALREKRWLDAADTLNIAVARDWRGDLKLKAMVLTNLSAAYIELGRFKEAESAAIEALGNDPELEAARQNREFAAKQLGAQASSPQ